MKKKLLWLFLRVAPRVIAANEGELTLENARTMLSELLALPAASNDAAIRSAHVAAKPTLAAANERRIAALGALGLKPDATAEQMHAAILALPAQIETARTAANEAQAREFDAKLDLAITQGRVLAHQKPVFQASFKADAVAANEQLTGQKVKQLNTDSSKVDGLGKEKGTIATGQERRALILAAVNERVAKGASYDDAYRAVHADPQFKVITEAQVVPAHQVAAAAV